MLYLFTTIEEIFFEIYALAVRLIVEQDNIYRYPDLVVIPNTDVAYANATTQPILIIEVLSKETEIVDRGEKLHQYSNLTSLQYYLLLSQNKPFVEMYSRLDGRWVLDFFTSLEETIALPILQVDLPLQTVYKKVKFPA